MAKDPAFLFYPSDFLTGVADLTMDERGQYITLLCLEHQKGRMSKKMVMLCCGNATADVLAKFLIDENGLYYNNRLEDEISKRKAHAEKQRQRALGGWLKRKATADATALPLEDINVNKDENRIKEKNEFVISEDDIGKTIQYLDITQQKKYSINEVTEFWKAFLIQNESKLYTKKQDRINHFRDWLKNQKHGFANNQTSGKGNNITRLEALRDY